MPEIVNLDSNLTLIEELSSELPAVEVAYIYPMLVTRGFGGGIFVNKSLIVTNGLGCFVSGDERRVELDSHLTLTVEPESLLTLSVELESSLII